MNNEAHTRWIAHLHDIFEQHLDDAGLDNEQLARALQLSERTLYRRVRALTGTSPTQYLREYRLERARTMMMDGKLQTVKEIAYAVGFLNGGYFIKQYQQQFAETPLETLKKAGWR